MTKEELAARLHGRSIGKEITPEEEQLAKDAGLVVVFGYSDDNVELRGVIHDEAGCYNGGEVELCEDESVLEAWDQVDHDSERACEEYFERKGLPHKTLVCKWGEGETYSWTYEIGVPCASFDVLENGEPWCRGIVFAIADLATQPRGAPLSKADPATAQETGKEGV